MKKKERKKPTVIVRNSSGVRIRHPDGTVEGDQIFISARREAIAVEGVNRIRREVAARSEGS